MKPYQITVATLITFFLSSSFAAEQTRTFTATNEDRAQACSIAKKKAEETAKISVGVKLKRTTACDCSKQSYEKDSVKAIASGKKAEWTCTTDAYFD